MMGETQEELSSCPTFNSYSLDRLDEIAARVTDEFTQRNLSVLRHDNDDGVGVGDDFEFSLVKKDGSGIFYDGQPGPIFPIFNRDLVVNGGRGDGASHRDNEQGLSDAAIENQIGIPLKDLFLQDGQEREPPSSSTSEADEMEGVPPGTFCVWRPKKVESSPSSLGKKSNSTGSPSKRWKFLNLLKRSNSEGKDTYVFLTPNHEEVKPGKNKPSSSEAVNAARKLKPRAAAAESPSSAHEALYIRNRAIKQGDKKKSYLPYRKDLLGFFANVNGLSRPFPLSRSRISLINS